MAYWKVKIIRAIFWLVVVVHAKGTTIASIRQHAPKIRCLRILLLPHIGFDGLTIILW